MELDYYKEEQTLLIELPKRIDVKNANEFEESLFNLPHLNEVKFIVMDAENLNYISSLGFRVILKFKKKFSDTFSSIVNVSDEICNIFNMTGMNSFIKLSKKKRKIDLNSLNPIASGMYGSVYRINEEQILKVFHGTYSEREIQRIVDVTRLAFMSGIQTIMPFEVVITEKGFGIILELLNAELMSNLMHENPQNLDKYVNEMVHIAKTLASTHFDEGVLRSRNEKLISEVDCAAEYLSPEEIETIKKYINAIPPKNTAVHGDFHAKNIMRADGEPLLIDMDEFSCGHPIWDVANTNCIYRSLAHDDPEMADSFFDLDGKISFADFYFSIIGCTLAEADIIWEKFFNKYFEDYSQEEKKSIAELLDFYGYFKHITFLINICERYKNNPEKVAEKVKHIRSSLKEMETKNLDELIKCLDFWK